MSSLNDIIARLPGLGSADARQSERFERVSAIPMPRSRRNGFWRLVERMPPLRTGVGSTLAIAFIASTWFYGSVVGGTAPTFVSGAAATVGLKATDIVITGQVETSEQDIFDSLQLGSKASLLGFDADAARQRILALPWIKNAAIRKLYPGMLKVALAEKRAVAVWQHQDRLTVVERSGKTIDRFGIADLIENRFSHLPHLVGEGAGEAASEILPLVADYPIIAARVSSYVRIANTRWDIQLDSGIRIKLPEQNAERALKDVAELASNDRLLEREITVVDMRVDDRIVLRLDTAAAKSRAEFVSARLKAMKKADRKL